MGTVGDPLFISSWTDKLYQYSGFTNTLKDSVATADNTPEGVSWDDTDAFYAGRANSKWYQLSGVSTTVLDSLSPGHNTTRGFSVNRDLDYLHVAQTADELRIQSGFTTTVKSSVDVSSTDPDPWGAGASDDHTTFSGNTGPSGNPYLYLLSGELTTTLKQSVAVTTWTNFVVGTAYDGTDVYFAENQFHNIHQLSGRFTSTLKASISSPTIANSRGWENGDYAARMGTAPVVDPDIRPDAFRRFASPKPPHPQQLRGRTSRNWRWSVYVPGTVGIEPPRRFLKGKPPHPSWVQGRAWRRGGVPEDYVATPIWPDALRRFLRSKPAHPSLLRGRHRRPFIKPVSEDRCQYFTQSFRIEDTSLDLYELYVGENEAPDFTTPTATSATLPFSWTPPTPATGSTTVLHVVVRKRNAFDLVSFNVYETLVEIDSAGGEIGGPVTAPYDVATYDADSGEVRVIANYLSDDDRTPADTWEVYATVGSDPVPGTDTPAYSGLMQKIAGEATVNEILTGYSSFDVVHIIVCAVRSSDTERSCAGVVQHTVADTLTLDDGYLFGGETYEQR